MRYADGPTASAEALVHATVERVWDLVTDIALPARFSSELEGATWLDDVPGVGARFVGRNRHPAIGEWETTSFVFAWEPGRTFGWHVSDPVNPSASWWFELEPRDGAVLVRQHGRIGPAPSGLSIAIEARPDKEERIVERRIEEHTMNLQATLDGIKSLAEADG